MTIPVYDSIGNAVAITDETGKAIERYEYAPYGTRTIRVDLTPPTVEQLREADGNLLLEFSEEVLLTRLQEAITAGTLTLRDTTDDEPVTITASQPVREGKQKGRRLLLTPDPGAPPEVNHAMLLHIEPSAMADLFENRSETAYEKAFVWLAADHVIEDTVAPRVELLLTRTGELELGFNEAIDPQSASQRILLDGQALTWIATLDGYGLKPQGAISATTHTLQVTAQLVDLGGNAIATPWSHAVTTGSTDQIVYERPDERITPTSTLDNLASFQGHITDPATGLVYMRNRWMDPEMGRFLTPDPMGYVDEPNAYAYAGNDPSNSSDPLGLYEEDVHHYLTWYLARAAGFSETTAAAIGFQAQELDLDPRSATEGGVDHGNMAKYHFVDAAQLASLSRTAREGAELSSSQLRKIGEFIHALEDTYSHQKNQQHRVFGDYFHDMGEGIDWGHGLHRHRPDWTWDRPELAMEMARETLEQLSELCQDYFGTCTPLPFESFESTVRQFVELPSDTYIDLKYGFREVPDVRDYTEKIQVLDPSFVPTRIEAAVREEGYRRYLARQKELENERARRASRWEDHW